MEFGFEVVAAKRPVIDAPAQQPMRPDKLARNPDTDTKKVRRQQARQRKTATSNWADGTCPQCGSDEVTYENNDDSDLAVASEEWASCATCGWVGSEDDVVKTGRRSLAVGYDEPDFGPVTPPPPSEQCPHCGTFNDSDYDPTLDPPIDADKFTCLNCGTIYHLDEDEGRTFASKKTRMTRGAAMAPFRRFASDDEDREPTSDDKYDKTHHQSEPEDWDEDRDGGEDEDAEDDDDEDNKREAMLLRAMAKANLQEQRALALELDTIRKNRRHRRIASQELDIANAHVRDCLTPVSTHALNTTATDWMGEIVDSDFEAVTDMDMQNDVVAQATLWYRRASREVKADRDEFAEQAMGMARRTAGCYGERAHIARRAFLDHVAHLHRVGQSGSELDADPSGQGQSGLPHEVPLGGNEETFDEDFWSDVPAEVPSTRAPVIRENARRHVAADFDEDAIDQAVRDTVNATRCPNCGSDNYGYNSTDGADCRDCGHHWWPPPPYGQPKQGRRRTAGEVPEHLKEHLFKKKDGGDDSDDGGDDKPDWLKDKIEGAKTAGGWRTCGKCGAATSRDTAACQSCGAIQKVPGSISGGGSETKGPKHGSRRTAETAADNWPLDKDTQQNPNVDDWFEDDPTTGDTQDLGELPGVKSRRVAAYSSPDDVIAAYPHQEGISAGQGFYEGDGDDLADELSSAGWRSVRWEAPYYWCMKAPNGQLLSYVEGDLYRGNKLTRSSSRRVTAVRDLSDIAWDIANDWKNPYFGAVPYIDAMQSLDSMSDMYGADSAKSIVSYFLSNAATWRGEKAKAVKAELKAMLSGKASSRTAAPSKADESGQGVSGLPQVSETGGPNDRPMWPWELPEGDPESGDDAANVSGTHTPGQSVGDYPQPKRGRRVVAEDDMGNESPRYESDDDGGGQTCSICGDAIERDPGNEDPQTWHHDNGEKHDHEAKPKGGDSKEGRRVLAQGSAAYAFGMGQAQAGEGMAQAFQDWRKQNGSLTDDERDDIGQAFRDLGAANRDPSDPNSGGIFRLMKKQQAFRDRVQANLGR